MLWGGKRNFSATGGGHESLLGALGDDEVAFIDGTAHKHSSAPKVAGATLITVKHADGAAYWRGL